MMQTQNVLSVADADRGRRRLLGFDLIRALAIIMVVVDHACKSLPHSDPVLIDVLMAPDAVLFIMLSGALLLPVEGSWAEFFARRFRRVFVPYLIWTCVHLLLLLAQGEMPLRWIATMLRWSWLTPYFGVGWFVFVIMGVYLFMPVLSPWIARATRRQLEYYVAMWLFGGCVLWMGWYMGMSREWNMAIMFLNYGGYAVAGYYFMRYPLGYRATGSDAPAGRLERAYLRYRKPLLIVFGALAGLIVPLIIWRAHFNSVEPKELLGNNFSVTVYAYACLVFAALVAVRKLPAWLQWAVNVVSRNAYGIYLTHLMLLGLVIEPLFPGVASSWWRLPVMLLAPLALSEVCRRLPVVGKYLV